MQGMGAETLAGLPSYQLEIKDNSLLPDGEVHACRKFPSLLGNIANSDLIEIYDSNEAERYRQGPTACRKCKIRNSCGGCPAVSYGFGLDPLEDLDPYCFIRQESNSRKGH